MTTAEILEQIEIELFGTVRASKWVEQIADEQESLAELREYEFARINSRTGIKGDRL